MAPRISLGGPPKSRRAEPMKTQLRPVSATTDAKAGAASPVAAARVRRAKSRRPGCAGFALAPATGMRPLTGVSPNRKGEQEAHHKEPIMAELRNGRPAHPEAQPAQSPDHPAAGSYG